MTTVKIRKLHIQNHRVATYMSGRIHLNKHFVPLGGDANKESDEPDKMQIVWQRINRLFGKLTKKTEQPSSQEDNSSGQNPMLTSTTLGKGFNLSTGMVDSTKNGLVVHAESIEEQKHEEVFFNPSDEVIVEDCCPRKINSSFEWLTRENDSTFWQVWSRHRLLGLK